MLLADLVMDFAQGIQAVDALAPVASSSRTGASYQPGIGPHTEGQTIKLVMAYLTEADPQRYASYQLGVPYGDGTRQTCDVCLGGPRPWDWAIEVKMLRLMGDNGKLNDNMVQPVAQRLPVEPRWGVRAASVGSQRMSGAIAPQMNPSGACVEIVFVRICLCDRLFYAHLVALPSAPERAYRLHQAPGFPTREAESCPDLRL
jgi:hypothetical protein